MNDTDLERQLRESLQRDADRITPRDRRTEIIAMVNDQTRVEEPPRRWLIPVGAAASVALIGAIAWGVSSNDGKPQFTPAVSSTSTSTSNQTSTSATTPTSTTPTQGRTSGQVPAATSDPNVAAATTQVALPAYFVGANAGTADRFGLYREFVRTTVPVGATHAQKAKAAVAVAMNAQPFTNFEPYVQPWSGTKVKGVELTPSLITITLTGRGASGFTADQTKLAVQELVWTAQAAIGQGPTPVKFVLADGSTLLFGTYPTSQTYNRPAKALQYEVLAPIWITTPERGQVFGSNVPVMATGESCAFEATTQWQLRRGGTTIRSGVTTASSGCPERGIWQVNLGLLNAGDYTFRMFEVSMAGGQGVVAETSKPFTVK